MVPKKLMAKCMYIPTRICQRVTPHCTKVSSYALTTWPVEKNRNVQQCRKSGFLLLMTCWPEWSPQEFEQGYLNTGSQKLPRPGARRQSKTGPGIMSQKHTRGRPTQPVRIMTFHPARKHLFPFLNHTKIRSLSVN